MKGLKIACGLRRVNSIVLFFVLGVMLKEELTGGIAVAEECSGMITVEEAVQAEDARYQAQTTNDVAAMERLFGQDLVYIHSSAAMDNKSSYIESMRSGTVKYRAMRRSDVKVRTYGCVALLTGNAAFDVSTKGEDLSIQLRFHSMWVKRPQGVQFVSWQSTRLPPTQ